MFKAKKIFSLILVVCMLAMLLLSVMPSMKVSAEYLPNTHTNTGNQLEDIIAVAKTQVGYYEGAEGSSQYTKYGNWYTNYTSSSYNYSYEPWCAMFVTWCARKANISASVIKTECYCPTFVNWFKNNGRWYTSPQRGDIIFFASSSVPSHVGIVYSVDSSYVYTIEGNTSNECKYKSYSRSSTYVIGYGRPNYGDSSAPPLTAPKFNLANNSVHDLASSDELEISWSSSEAVCYNWDIKVLDGEPDPTNDDEPGTIIRYGDSQDATALSLYGSTNDIYADVWIRIAVAAKDGWSSTAEQKWSVIYVKIIDSSLDAPTFNLTNYSTHDLADSDELEITWNSPNAKCYSWDIKRLDGEPDESVADEPGIIIRYGDLNGADGLSLYGSWGDLYADTWIRIAVAARDDWQSDAEQVWSVIYVKIVNSAFSAPTINVKNYSTFDLAESDELEITWNSDSAVCYSWKMIRLDGEPDVNNSSEPGVELRASKALDASGLSLYGTWGDLVPNTWVKIAVAARTSWEDNATEKWNCVYVKITNSFPDDYLFRPITESNITLDSDDYCNNISNKTTVSSFLEMFDIENCTVVIDNIEGNEITSGYIGTGCQIKVYRNNTLEKQYTAVVVGDIDGDGKITVTDYLQVKRYMQKMITFDVSQKRASDTNSNDSVDATDYLQIKRFFQNIYTF